jgi:hypothetical protein
MTIKKWSEIIHMQEKKKKLREKNEREKKREKVNE